MKTALITGGAKGIGAAIAIRLSKAGYNVIINYNSSANKAEALVTFINKNTKENIRAVAYKCDVSDFARVSEMMQFIYKNFGKIDVLVNNAGVLQESLLIDVTPQKIAETINVNLIGTINCCKAAIDCMIHNEYGRIINISSVSGKSGASFSTIYSASKSGVDAFTKSLAKELANAKITVNAIGPGPINTDMCNDTLYSSAEIKEIINEIPIGRIGTVDDVARVAEFLASEESDFITGQIIYVDGGYAI